MSGGPGPQLALVGSGEFLPVMAPVDAQLLSGRAPRAVFLPTAAALDGAARVQYWIDLGIGHYEGLGVEAVPVPVLDRSHADDPGLAALVAGAGLVYLSGGNPGYLAATLRGTRVWAAILEAVAAGAALGGCSAGAMAMGAIAPDTARRELDGGRAMGSGLGVVPHVAVIPHFDKMVGWSPGIVDRYLAARPSGVHVVGIDEDTALVGGPDTWTVAGRGGVHLLGPGGPRVLGAGATVTLTAAEG